MEWIPKVFKEHVQEAERKEGISQKRKLELLPASEDDAGIHH